MLQLKVVPAVKCPKKDVLSALDIYCKTVDPGSMTDTNQIKDYIWNTKEHSREPRAMFFYLLYSGDNTVEGFAEYAYLSENQVLMLDYLCTRQRNHVMFYNFYHMTVQEIEETLKNKGLFVRYIITELSLAQMDGKLIDVDSNYFRHLLSNENYRLLRYPYYQPPLLECDEVREFSLAIKLMSVDNNDFLVLEKAQYLSIVKEIYYSHYLAWYQNRSGFRELIQQLLTRIEQEILKNRESEPVALVQCKLFEEGQCPRFAAENVTLPRARKKKWKTRLLVLIWSMFSIFTFVLCVIPLFSDVATIMCSFLTIIAGIISIVSYRKDFFGS